jgi:elongation factor P--(R)-beta-lysine ligase
MPSDPPSRPWWHPTRHADRRPLLLARNRIQATLRDWFLAEGFTEVDPAALQISPGNEAHLHALETRALTTDGRAETRYLHTSPEFAMKKLLAAGESRIFAFAHVFRNRESGPLHAREFTMLEWYRAGEPYEVLIEDCAAVLARTAEAAGAESLRWREARRDPYATPDRLPLAEAALRAGIDLATTLGADGTPDAAALAEAMRDQGLTASPDDSWSDMLSRLLPARIEPALGRGRPTALDRYPACEAALARRCPDDPRFAERFELYACGVELANAFCELTDVAEQRARFAAAMEEKARIHGERYPVDEDFLAALAQMPPASGIALGFDRLVMLATGAERIEQVIWAPVADT